MSRGAIIVALAAALCFAGAAASSFAQTQTQNLTVTGRWAVSQQRCDSETLEFGTDGRFRSTLDQAEPREGTYRTGRDRIILVDEAEPDRELALIVIDFAPARLVAFDETIEADRRLVKCR
jgi:hypothetical protein